VSDVGHEWTWPTLRLRPKPAAGVIHEGELSVIDRVVDQPVTREHRWRMPRRTLQRPKISRGTGAAAREILARMAWIVVFPVYLLVAAVIAVAYVLAAIVVGLRHRSGEEE
jgi:hypothetical protein